MIGIDFRVAKLAYWIQKLTEDQYTDFSDKEQVPDRASISPISIRKVEPSFELLANFISRRYSSRNFSGEKSTYQTCLDILRLAYGSFTANHRTVPSAGGFYPLTLWLLEIREGVVIKVGRYDPLTDKIMPHSEPNGLLAEGFRVYQVNFSEVSWVILWTCSLIKPGSKYGARGYRFTMIEVGHSAQMAVLGCCMKEIQHITLGGIIESHVRNEWLLSGRRHLPQYALAFR